MLTRLGSFSRVILFDKRGCGVSDRVPPDELASLETRMDDLRAVMDAVGSRRAVLYGVSEGGPMAMLFAATYPDRTIGLAVYGSHWTWVPTDWSAFQEELDEIERCWGTEECARRASHSLARGVHPPRAASPGAALAYTPNERVDRRSGRVAVDPGADARGVPNG